MQMSSKYQSLAETPVVAIISKQYNMFIKTVNDVWVENFNILIILRNHRGLTCLNGFDIYLEIENFCLSLFRVLIRCESIWCYDTVHYHKGL